MGWVCFFLWLGGVRDVCLAVLRSGFRPLQFLWGCSMAERREGLGSYLVGGVRVLSLLRLGCQGRRGSSVSVFRCFPVRVHQDVRLVGGSSREGVGVVVVSESVCMWTQVGTEKGRLDPAKRARRFFVPSCFSHTSARRDGCTCSVELSLCLFLALGLPITPPQSVMLAFQLVSSLSFLVSLGSRFPLPPFLSSLRRLLLLCGRLLRLRLACRWSFVEAFCLGVRS